MLEVPISCEDMCPGGGVWTLICSGTALEQVPYWMLTSTDAGRSMRMSASTVLGVGSRMSISRLCVRISKCSRESLYLWGERITQYTFFSVGNGTGPATLAPVRVTVSTILRAEVSITSWS